MKRPSPLIIELFTEKLNFQKENNKEGKGTEKKKIKSDPNIETVSVVLYGSCHDFPQ